ncbi:uncharacterized protein GLRG_04545 [Colletotrichum graminicola M1.001]|uniref:Uncharacterized protein n=1 Tax=Colletotrichum graminicola (strain M1.001 / M2 / FGSC 10212) TaxID=645133 RepID=E3QEU5_COLGM|nr:uncharacterized protein GLRG_04545 [Colletotrichum graminicola M1.001]EFQ29401.1 hypothetical protein GLRG_04545 [Colletotrichum graminicola M1.001]
MELDQNAIYYFLDCHHNAKRSGSIPAVYQATQPGLGSGQAHVLSEDSKLFEHYFDYDLYARGPKDNPTPPHIMADDASQSVHDSGSTTETSSIRTPETLLSNPGSPLTDYGPPNPEDHPYGNDDLASPDLNEFHNHPFLFPSLKETPNPPREQTLQVPTKKRSRPDSPNGKTRRVRDVSKTNQVRSTGSCTRCRIQKVDCTTSGTCERCVKAYPGDPNSACVRKELLLTALDLSSAHFAGLERKAELEANHLLQFVRSQYYVSVHRGHVVFGRDPHGARLPTALQNYCRMSDDGQRPIYQGCILARGSIGVPSWDGLIRWGEKIDFPEDRCTFEGLIELFIKDYSAPCRTGGPRRPQMHLLDDVHKMKVMYKICCEENFNFIREGTNAIEPLPLPVKAELRNIARGALAHFEKSALGALDKYLAPKKVPACEVPALWASLWQLLFIYRDLLRTRAPSETNAVPLLNAVAVFYAAHFRTSASLRLSLDGVRGSWDPRETGQAALASTFDHALRLRDTLHRTIAAGTDQIDSRLKDLVVDPEMKVLNRRQPSNKSAKGK